MKLKKKSSYQKGNQYEREVVLILEDQEWTTFRQHRKPVWIQGKMIMVGCDIFGCDIIAKKAGLATKWIQVSTEDNKHKKIAQVSKFSWNYPHEEVELWCRIKGKKAYLVYSGPKFKDTRMEVVPYNI